MALLLLRISVAATSLLCAMNLFDAPSHPLLFAVVVLMSISLSVGFLTPYLSMIASVSAVANLFIGPYAGKLISIFPILNAVALALLGPGAYAVDAKLFGLRVTVVPPRKDLNHS